MELEIIKKRENVPAFDPRAIKIRHIEYYPAIDGVYEADQITEALVAVLLAQIPEGINVYLSLDADGEEDSLEVVCDGEWLALGYYFDEECYYSYNAAFADTEDLTPLLSGGQSPIEKYLALQDIEAGVQAVAYFIRTGERYPGIDWARQL